MTVRAWVFASLAGLLAAAAGCVVCSGSDEPPELAPLDLGVTTDLNAIAGINEWIGERRFDAIAVGQSGTIVVWGYDLPDRDAERFVLSEDLGDADLHGIWIDRREHLDGTDSWWVVGDAGLVATSDNHGATWNAVTLASGGASFHAIDGAPGQPVIVGDEIVLVRLADGTWAEPPTPAAGWGLLRGITTTPSGTTLAVGLGGVIWSTEDPTSEWTAVSSEGPDLLDIGAGIYPISDAVVVGAEGTVLIHDAGAWTQVATGVSVDFIDYAEFGQVLAADGGVYELDSEGALTSIETHAGARALMTDDYHGLTLVGDAGYVIAPVEASGC